MHRRRPLGARVLVSLCVATMIAQAGSAPAFSSPAQPFDQDPIVFIHGCPPGPFTNEDARNSINRMRDRFAAAGYPETHLHSILFNFTCGTNATAAAEIAEFVQTILAQTGAEKVDMIAHSLGAFAARLYLKRGGHVFVRDFVSLAGTNHGLLLGAINEVTEILQPDPNDKGSAEMFPIYECAGVQLEVNGCLTLDGRTVQVDETPGNVRYLSLWNEIEQAIVPRESACLNMRRWNDCSDPVNEPVIVLSPNPHSDIQADEAVFLRVYEHVTTKPGNRPD